MKYLVFLLEEPSAKDLLAGLLPRILPEGHEVKYLVFEGKQDLEKNLIRKIRGWLVPNSFFIVMRDQDAADCRQVKAKLQELVRETGCKNVMIRVVCRTLESWVLGDWGAVAEAFHSPKLSHQNVKERYRDPDRVRHPIDELRKFLPDYQKRDGARRVGTKLNPERNQSESFGVFIRGLNRVTKATF